LLELAPCSLEEANAFVARHHRHHHPTPVAKFSIAATDGDKVVGVVIVGLPKARLAMDGWTLEVTRLASDGTRNACSLLYGAARKAAFALGYKRIITYTLAEENGASLLASGFELEADVTGRSWKTHNRRRFVDDRNPISDKKRWGAGVKRETPPPRVEVVGARRTEHQPHAQQREPIGILADADGRQSGNGDVQRSWRHDEQPKNAPVGFWTGAEWIACTDGKWRPVEPGTFPLAHGLPARVVRLRGYGNAINPHQAAEFIRASGLIAMRKEAAA
jgi:hypothetical protein